MLILIMHCLQLPLGRVILQHNTLKLYCWCIEWSNLIFCLWFEADCAGQNDLDLTHLNVMLNHYIKVAATQQDIYFSRRPVALSKLALLSYSESTSLLQVHHWPQLTWDLVQHVPMRLGIPLTQSRHVIHEWIHWIQLPEKQTFVHYRQPM